MKITEINCDMDGVLADFDCAVASVYGKPIGDTPLARREFWTWMAAYGKRGGRFYADLPVMHDASVLWSALHVLASGIPVVICSATGHIQGVREQKLEWLKLHFGEAVARSARIVRNGKDKAQYASPTSLLIDDRQKVIDPWVAAGGIAILHTSAESTIRQLREMIDGV